MLVESPTVLFGLYSDIPSTLHHLFYVHMHPPLKEIIPTHRCFLVDQVDAFLFSLFLIALPKLQAPSFFAGLSRLVIVLSSLTLRQQNTYNPYPICCCGFSESVSLALRGGPFSREVVVRCSQREVSFTARGS
jgi:hypothetical protein